MIVVNYLAAVALFGIGLYAVLTRRNMIKMVMGLSLMEASTYLFMISLAYRAGSTAPVLLSPPPGKSGFPRSISASTVAVLKRSARWSNGSPATCSGAR